MPRWLMLASYNGTGQLSLESTSTGLLSSARACATRRHSARQTTSSSRDMEEDKETVETGTVRSEALLDFQEDLLGFERMIPLAF